MNNDQPIVSDAPGRARFEAHLGSRRVGFAAYKRADDLIVFTHTEVDPSFEGRGIGTALVREALDAVRMWATARVVPLCPFVEAFIDQQPEYRDLVFVPPTSMVGD